MDKTTSEAPRTPSDPIAEGIALLRGAAKPQEKSAGDVTAVTTPDAPSEGQVQEKTAETPKVEPPSKMTPEQLKELIASKDGQAMIYRQAQAMKDREAHQERLRQQQEQARSKVAEMDDEEFGRHLRTTQQEQEAVRQQMTPVIGKLLTDAQDQALSQISDEAIRAEVATKANAGEYKTFPEFLAACINAEAQQRTDKQVKREVAKREKELRESIQNELTADQADVAIPQLGRGIPTSRVSDLHGIDAIREGLARRAKK